MCIEPSNLPLFIHCLDGANVTGVVVMCLRKLQNWNLSATFTEFTRLDLFCCSLVHVHFQFHWAEPKLFH